VRPSPGDLPPTTPGSCRRRCSHPLFGTGVTAVDAAPFSASSINSGAKCDGATNHTPATQDGADVPDITIHGGILSLYQDANTVLTGETYYGVARCQPAWYVTGPAHDVSIDNVTTYAGSGRIRGDTTAIHVSHQTSGAKPDC
jgi:hypothetical protein